MQREHALARGSRNIVPFPLGLEFDLLYLGVQLTVGVRLTLGFPSRNPGARGGTMSVDIADIPNPLRRVGGGGQH